MLTVRAVGTTGRKRRLCDNMLSFALGVLHTVDGHCVCVVHAAYASLRRRGFGGEVASRAVEVDYLAAPVGSFYGIEEIFPLLLMSRLGREPEGRTVRHVRR